MKQLYFILYVVGLSVYVLSLAYYAFNVVEKRLTPEVSSLQQINVNVRGGKNKYNNYILSDKDYYLTRSKGALGTIIAKKELSQFDVEAINRQENESVAILKLPVNPVRVSYFIDQEGDKKPFVPIGFREGAENQKDGWYYFTLLGYAIRSLFFLIFLGVNAALAIKILSSGGNSGTRIALCSVSLLILIAAFTVF
ncbi:MAG: hypothetical protein LUH22_18690 [Bacteroides sp.]|nr:hypothetical protein [Bacteroides sp.]